MDKSERIGFDRSGGGLLVSTRVLSTAVWLAIAFGFGSVCATGAVAQSSLANPHFQMQKQASTSVTSMLTDNPVTRSISSAWKKGVKAATPEPLIHEAPDPVSLHTASPQATPRMHVAMANLQARQGNFGEARKHYQQALKLDSGYLSAIVGLAHLEDRSGNLEKATQIYRLAIQRHPNAARLHNDLGLCYARQNRYDESVRALERAISLAPKKALYRNNIAKVLVEQNQLRRALDHLAAVHSGDVAHYNLGQLLYQRGEQHRAAGMFAKALELNARLQPAREMLARIQVAPQTVAGDRVALGPSQVAVQRHHRRLEPKRERLALSTSLQNPISEPRYAKAGRLAPAPMTSSLPNVSSVRRTASPNLRRPTVSRPPQRSSAPAPDGIIYYQAKRQPPMPR